jgi:hypothetical protein
MLGERSAKVEKTVDVIVEKDAQPRRLELVRPALGDPVRVQLCLPEGDDEMAAARRDDLGSNLAKSSRAGNNRARCPANGFPVRRAERFSCRPEPVAESARKY